jgi:cysteine desulfurase
VFFTSGATESNNLILQGLLAHRDSALLASAVEHKCVLEVGRALAANGTLFEMLPVDGLGTVLPGSIRSFLGRHLGREVVVLAVMHANNEIGTVQPINDISKPLTADNVFLHVDGSQSVGKIPVDVSMLGADSLSLSSHKLYGPAGIGAVFISRRVRHLLRPLMYGGGQQSGVRPGTLPVFLSVGFGAACALAVQRQEEDARNARACANAFVDALKAKHATFVQLGHPTESIPGLVSVRFPGCDSGDLLTRVCQDVFASTGAACSAGVIQASHVSRAIGLSESEGLEVVRFGFGRHSTVPLAVQAASLVAKAREAIIGLA